MSDQPKRPRPATATDVARRAGVSQPTVSRVFSKSSKIQVQPAARERVLAAAAELGYVPNAIAQTMASRRSGIVGIVVSSYYNLFYYHILQLLTNQLLQRGLRAMVFTSDPKGSFQELLQNFCQYQVDGVIVTSSALCHRVDAQWSQRGMPVVLCNGYLPGMEINAVQSDHFDSGLKMADYLTAVGHRRFAYISSESSPHRNYLPRQEGFLSGLQAHGVGDCRIVPAGYSYESGMDAGRVLLKEATLPDAIFCSGDQNAFGVMDALRQGRPGLRLGEDVSITGYDAPILEKLGAYALTGFSQQTELLCQDCIALLLALMESPGQPVQVRTHPMVLHLRQSSRPLLAGKQRESVFREKSSHSDP